MKTIWALLLAGFILMGCRGGGIDDERTAVTPTNSAPTPTAVPDPRYDGPPPDKGTGHVTGQILWNGTAAVHLDLLLCHASFWFDRCKGEDVGAAAVTDETGAYLFQNVPPGTYSLSIHVFDSEDWVYITDGLITAADFTVEADKTLVIRPENIYKLDLRPSDPTDQAQMKGGSHTLRWDPYPDAAYYEIYLSPERGPALFVSKRVEGTHIAADLPPSNCTYHWKVAAFNNGDIKIAEMRRFSRFQVAGESVSCTLAVNQPSDKSVISAHGIILDWEPHPAAANYKVLLWDDTAETHPHILDFLSVAESRFRLNGALTPDHRYVWAVYAYDAAGQQIAASQTASFTTHAE